MPPALAKSLPSTHRIASELDAPDVAATHRYAAQLATRYRKGGTLFLLGALGAGKTTVVQALVKALGYVGLPKSPSFVLQHVYLLDGLAIEHWDLYRLADAPPEEIVGIARELGSHGQLVLVEWPEPLIALNLHTDADILAIEVDPITDARHLTLWEAC